MQNDVGRVPPALALHTSVTSARRWEDQNLSSPFGKRLTAGFRQNSSSFCAVASCCASTWTPPFASSCIVGPDSLAGDAGFEPAPAVFEYEMPVLRRTSAIEAMQHRFGSRAR